MKVGTKRPPNVLRRIKDNLRRRKRPRGSEVPTCNEIEKHMRDTCIHCGVTLSWDRGPFRLDKGTFDRVDNEGFHEINNLVSSCYACNVMRNNMSVKEFYEFLERLFSEPGEVQHFVTYRDVYRANYHDTDHVREMLRIQNGRCYMTGVAFESKGPRRFSVDRIDSTKGYVRENVALCIQPVNRMKNQARLLDALTHLDRLRKFY